MQHPWLLTAVAPLVAALLGGLLVPGPAAAQAQLYEITWKSSGAYDAYYDPTHWSLSGSGYAILAPIQPYERPQFSSATHTLILTWDQRTWGGLLPAVDDPFEPPRPASAPPAPLCQNVYECSGSLTISGDTFSAAYSRGNRTGWVDFSASGRRITSPPSATTVYPITWFSFSESAYVESASLVATGVATLEVFAPLTGGDPWPAFRLAVADRVGGPQRAVATFIGEDWANVGGAVRTETLPVALSGVSGAWGGGAWSWGGGSFLPRPPLGSVGSAPDGPMYFTIELAGAGVRADGTYIRTQFVGHGQRSDLAAAVTSPAEGAAVNGTVTVGMSETGATGTPITFTLTVDGTQIFTTSGTATTASFTWNSASVGNATHTLNLTVRDGAGRIATAARTVTVNNAAPPPPPPATVRVFITQPATDGAAVSGTAWFTVWIENAAAGSKTYTLSVGGTKMATTTTTSNGPVSIPWSTTGMTNGSHAVTVTVSDSAGAIGSAARTVNVSN